MISENRVGIYLGSSSRDNTAHYNNIYNNTEYGIEVSDNNEYAISATSNWWGAASGPYHPTKNSEGEGDNITDYVEFEPWLEEKIIRVPVAYIESIYPNPAIVGKIIRFEGSDKNEGIIILYVWRSSIDGEFYNGTENECTTASLSLGEHTIYFKIQNESEVWSDEVTESLTINGIPIAIIDSISPNPAMDTDIIHFQGNGTDDGNITHFAWRSSIDGEFYNGTESDFYYGDLSNGSHTIYFKVQDDYGVWSDEVSTELEINGIPIALIVSISPNPALDEDNIHFKGNGIDDGSITNYSWHSDVDGELYNGTSDNFTISNLTRHEHNIILRLQDDKGIWSDTVNRTLMVTRKPVVIIGEITPNPALTTDMVTFTIAELDCRCGDYFITQYVWRSDIDGELYNDPDDHFTYTGLSNGTHTIYLKGQDEYGFWSDEVNETLVVHEKPVARIDLISPEFPLNTENITFSGSGTDDGLIERYAWRVEDTELYNGTDSSFTSSPFLAGNYTIHLKVQDNIGVWSDEANTDFEVINLILPNNIPIVLITSPNDGDVVSGIITINGTASDEDSTVEKMEYFNQNAGEWLSIGGTDSWEFTVDTRGMENGEHTYKFRCYDGQNYSEKVSITLIVENKDNGEDDDEDGESITGIIGIGVILIIVGCVIGFLMIRQHTSGLQESPSPSLPPSSMELISDDDGSWFCPECNNKLSEDSMSCTNCGFKKENEEMEE